MAQPNPLKAYKCYLCKKPSYIVWKGKTFCLSCRPLDSLTKRERVNLRAGRLGLYK